MACFVKPAPRNAPWMTIRPPKKPQAKATIRRNLTPSAMTAASAMKIRIRPPGKANASAPKPNSASIAPAVARHATVSARSGVRAPRFWPTPVAAAWPTAPETVHETDIIRRPMP